MEAAPLKSEIYTEKPPKMEIIEELILNKEKINYKIQFGIEFNQNELLSIKIFSQQSENLFHYQTTYTISELQKLSKAFSVYETVKDIISLLKKLNYEIQENNDENMLIRFNIYLPDGQNEVVELNLEKKFSDKKQIIKYFLNELKLIENNTLNSQEKLKKEISELKEKNKKVEIDITNLKTNISQYKKGINLLLIIISSLFLIFSFIMNHNFNQFKKSLINNNIAINVENKNNIQEMPEKINNIFEDKKIVEEGMFANTIGFILNYIKQNDILMNLTEIKLLYKSSRDGDETKVCHKLCDNKKNILLLIKSNNDYIFGGYTKVGFKNKTSKNNFKDNESFLFSVNLTKIYRAIKDKNVIGHFKEERGLCFTESLYFYDKFLKTPSYISNKINEYFNGFEKVFEMNGGKKQFIIKELEVYELI